MNIKSVKYIITNFYVGHRLTAIKTTNRAQPCPSPAGWQPGPDMPLTPCNFPLCLRSLGFP
jgi:hypothetical protein